MTECEQMRENISLMLDGELDAAERAALADHLDACPDCAALYAAFAALGEGLRESAEEPPAELSERVMAQIRREAAPKKRRRVRLVPVLAAAACLVLILGLGRFALGGRKGAAMTMEAAMPAEAPMEAAAAEEAVETEEAAVAEEPMAPASLPTLGAAANAAGEADAQSAEDRGAPEYDLRESLSLAELRELLAGVPSRMDPAALDPWCVLLVADGEKDVRVAVYSLDGAIYWADPEEETLTLADCGADALAALLP